MTNALLAGALVLVALVAAWILGRRGPDAPTQGRWTVPAQVDRRDFAHPGRPWLVAAFTSATCDSCADITVKVAALDSDAVAVDVVEVGVDKARHDRYGIDAVPTVLVTDGEGVVIASFVGPVDTAELWSTLAEVRDGTGGAAGDPTA